MLANELIIPDETWGEAATRPLLLDRSRPGDAERMNHLVGSGQVRSLHDTIERQIHDLVRVRARCGDLPPSSLREGRGRVLDGRDPADFGRWVFYPWSGRLVHVLPPAEFAELRLDRNRHKVTAEEQARLRDFHVGVVGLASAGEAALTLAMEGACGRLTLADFATLSLADLNRVRAGVHDLETPRTVLVARRIYELDPYASLTLFPEGLGEANADAFFGGAHPLDAVVDGCGDPHARVLLRERARSARIPVLTATGDRGTLESERFDLEPERPLFGGRAGEITADGVRAMEDDSRRALELVIGDAERASARTAASWMEMRSTVTHPPRLASDAAIGAAAVTLAVRRLALGQPLASGHRRVDADAILAEGAPAPAVRAAAGPRPRALAGVDGRIPELVRFCVHHGTLAPSAANRQPWRFRWDGERLWVLHDRNRSGTLLDPAGREAHLALGAALENVAVAAAHRGWRARAEPFPRPRDPLVAAAVTFEPAMEEAPEDADLFPQLALRATNRRSATRVPLGAGALTALADAARSRGARLDLLTGDEEVAELAKVIGAGERIRWLCRELHHEMVGELRWSREAAERAGDGIPLDALELTSAQRAALRVAMRPDVAAALRELGGGRVFGEAAERAVARSSAVGLVTVGGLSPTGALRGGRAMERVWLRATALGLAVQPTTALIYLFEMLDGSAATIFTAAEREELRRLRERFDTLFSSATGGTRLILFRIGVAAAPTARSPRLPLEAVLTYGRPTLAAA